MSFNFQHASNPPADGWEGLMRAFGLAGVFELLEKQALERLGEVCPEASGRVVRCIYRGLPILVPETVLGMMRLQVTGLGEGHQISCVITPLLAGLVISAHAAHGVARGADPRFPVSGALSAYSYVVANEAIRSATDQIDPEEVQGFMAVLGVDW